MKSDRDVFEFTNSAEAFKNMAKIYPKNTEEISPSKRKIEEESADVLSNFEEI